MQNNRYFFMIYIFLFNPANGLLAKLDNSNLLSLLQHPVAKSASAAAPKLQNLRKHSTDISAASIVPTPKAQIDSLLENIEAVQSNVDYQDALKILSDKNMRAAYHDDMVSIQLFLLDYITQIVQKYSVQAKKVQKSMSLTNLLQKIEPESASNAHHQLSNLINLIQKKSNQTVAGVKAHINLTEFLTKEARTLPVALKPKVDLQHLLQTSSFGAQALVSKTEKPNNLLNLLSTGQ